MTPINRCPKCHGVIQYAVGPTGKSIEVNPDGTDHSCQNAAPTNGTNTEPIVATTAAVKIPVGNNHRPVIEPMRIINETVTRIVSVRPDSLELGTPGKSGCIKIYFDASDVADAEQRLRNAIALRDLANTLTSYPTPIARAGKVHA